MKITDSIAMLELSGPNGAIYPTLTWDENNLVLIDAGFPGQADALVTAIEAEGFRAEGVTHIILTHWTRTTAAVLMSTMRIRNPASHMY